MSKPDSTAFSQRDLELLALALQCVKGGDIAIDYEKFAVVGGYKNAASSTTGWHRLKKKLDKAKGSVDAGEPVAKSIETPEASPTKGKKRKNAAASADEMDGDDEETSAKTPVKRGRKTTKQEPAIKEDEEEKAVKEEISDHA